MRARHKSNFPLQLKSKQTIAFIMSSRLGDSLISMIVVNNLIRNGFAVTVFGDYIHALKDWFPTLKIHATPRVAHTKEIFKFYDVILHAFPTDVIGDTAAWHPCVRVFDTTSTYRLRIPMPDVQVAFCRHELLLNDVVRENNIKPPANLLHRKYPHRVVIHPTSYQIHKNWLPQRFLAVGKILQAKGFQPEFIVSPEERKDWLWIIDQGMPLPQFDSLHAVASWIFESGWFIGNDSGIGHLASNLGIETLTLGGRARSLQRWRPAWARGAVLLPPIWLVTRPIKERYWKYLISVQKVVTTFLQLVETSSFKE